MNDNSGRSFVAVPIDQRATADAGQSVWPPGIGVAVVLVGVRDLRYDPIEAEHDITGRSLPDGCADLDRFRGQRLDRAGGVIHEYRLVE